MFKNPNSSLFQNMTSGVLHLDYHVIAGGSGCWCVVDAWIYPKTHYENHNDYCLSNRIHKSALMYLLKIQV